MRATIRIAVGKRTFLDEGQGFETFVGVWAKGKPCIVRWVNLRSMVVQKQKRIQVGKGCCRERPLGEQAANGFVVRRHDVKQGWGVHGFRGKQVCKMR